MGDSVDHLPLNLYQALDMLCHAVEGRRQAAHQSTGTGLHARTHLPASNPDRNRLYLAQVVVYSLQRQPERERQNTADKQYQQAEHRPAER